MKEQNRLDEQLKDKLYDHDLKPKKEVWNRIAVGIAVGGSAAASASGSTLTRVGQWLSNHVALSGSIAASVVAVAGWLALDTNEQPNTANEPTPVVAEVPVSSPEPNIVEQEVPTTIPSITNEPAQPIAASPEPVSPIITISAPNPIVEEASTPAVVTAEETWTPEPLSVAYLTGLDGVIGQDQLSPNVGETIQNPDMPLTGSALFPGLRIGFRYTYHQSRILNQNSYGLSGEQVNYTPKWNSAAGLIIGYDIGSKLGLQVEWISSATVEQSFVQADNPYAPSRSVQMKYQQFPLLLKYKKLLRTPKLFSVAALAGVQYSRFQSATLQIEGLERGISARFNNSDLALAAGLELEYYLNSSLFLGAGIRSTLGSDINSADWKVASGKSRVLTTGLNVSLNYYLSGR